MNNPIFDAMKSERDRAVRIVQEEKDSCKRTYAIVCENETQKAIAETVDNILEYLIKKIKGEIEG